MSIAVARHEPASSAATAGRWLTPLREHWSAAVAKLLNQHPAVVRVLIASKRGSAPREAGSCMLVTATELHGTIGGGHLEWQAQQLAQRLLADSTLRAVQVKRMILGKELAQCCGGEVHLWLERYSRSDLSFLKKLARLASSNSRQALVTRCDETTVTRELQRINPADHDTQTTHLLDSHDRTATLIEPIEHHQTKLWLYGAGHVGQALVRVLSDLPFNITWIDSRAELLPGSLPATVQVVQTDSAVTMTRNAPADVHHRVLTHEHALDYALCHEILTRNEFTSLGLIGSKSKGARFRAQLRRDGVAAERIARLICPIGSGINSKLPAAIAVSIAAQLLQPLEQLAAATQALLSVAECDSHCASCKVTQLVAS